MNNRDTNADLLHEMYRNVRMGCESITDVLPKIDNKFMITELTGQFEDYSGFANRISDMMHERGITPKEPGMMAKAGAKMGNAINTAIDSTASHIAEMVIKGTEMGIRQLEDLSEQLADQCDKKVSDLCRDLLDWEKKTAKKMQEFTEPSKV